MADVDKPQGWFLTVTYESIYHTDLLVAQGLLRDFLPELRSLASRLGGVVKVFALEKALPLPPQATREAQVISEAATKIGMICRTVAHLSHDTHLDSWKRAYSHVWEGLSDEQRIAELDGLKLRVERDLAALRIRKELTTPTPKGDEVPLSKPPSQPSPLVEAPPSQEDANG